MDTNAIEPSTTNPTAHSSQSKPKGKGAKAKAEARFRAKKNDTFQAELTASILRRLKVSDPTNINAINLQSSIVPARIPISLRGLPNYVYNLWNRMKAIGTRPFAALATEENYAIFLKCIMYIAEAKVTYSQMKVDTIPPFPLTSLDTFTEMQLRTITSISKRLPFPIVIFLEAIGFFTIQRQTVVPILCSVNVNAASAAFSFAPSHIQQLLAVFKDEVIINNVLYTMSRELSRLPFIEWVRRDVAACVDNGVEITPAQSFVSISENTRRFWVPPTPNERMIFEQIIASMESKPGFLLSTDITTGVGSIIQAVRFPEEYSPDDDETLYYTNVEVPEFEEKLAPALMLGQEYAIDGFSRFMGSYQECLKHGSACAPDALHAVIWANN